MELQTNTWDTVWGLPVQVTDIPLAVTKKHVLKCFFMPGAVPSARYLK